MHPTPGVRRGRHGGRGGDRLPGARLRPPRHQSTLSQPPSPVRATLTCPGYPLLSGQPLLPGSPSLLTTPLSAPEASRRPGGFSAPQRLLGAPEAWRRPGPRSPLRTPLSASDPALRFGPPCTPPSPAPCDQVISRVIPPHPSDIAGDTTSSHGIVIVWYRGRYHLITAHHLGSCSHGIAGDIT